MSVDLVVLGTAAVLVASGLAAAARRRHSLAGIVGGQLAGIGAAVGVVGLVGPTGEQFAVLVVALAGLAGFLTATLQGLEDEAPGDEADPGAVDGDPLRW